MSDLSGTVDLTPVLSKGQIRRFVRLPFRLYRDVPGWVGPLVSDDRRRLDARHNPAISHCDTTAVLAWRGGKPVGRVLGIINRKSDEHSARFSHFDCVDDEAVASALLGHVETWARKKGCSRIVGPMGFSDQDPEGLLVEGFDEVPSLATLYGPAYLRLLIEYTGYRKEVDYVTYLVPLAIPGRVEKIVSWTLERGPFRILEFRRRSELKKYAYPILQLMNETYRGLYGFVPLQKSEMDDLARRYIPLLDPRFVKLVYRGAEAVAFVIGVPNFAEGLRRARGHLYPFGLVHIARSMRRSRRLDLLLGGVREDCRGRGVDAILGVSIIRSAMRAGLSAVDTHHILETNSRMRAEAEEWGGTVYKRHRIFEKVL